MFRVFSSRIFRAAVVAAAVLAAAGASADMIPYSITGIAGSGRQHGDSFDPGDGSFSRILNGSGLTVGNPLSPSTWTHNNRWQDNWQGSGSFSGGSTPGMWFVADFGSTRALLDDLYIWNVREVLDRGTRNIILYYATSPTVTPVTDSAYSFASGGWTSLGSFTVPQATAGGTPADLAIDLSSIPSARYVGFDIQSNWGSTFRVGFAELQFTLAPEPGTLSILALGALALWRRRRQR